MNLKVVKELMNCISLEVRITLTKSSISRWSNCSPSSASPSLPLSTAGMSSGPPPSRWKICFGPKYFFNFFSSIFFQIVSNFFKLLFHFLSNVPPSRWHVSFLARTIFSQDLFTYAKLFALFVIIVTGVVQLCRGKVNTESHQG